MKISGYTMPLKLDSHYLVFNGLSGHLDLFDRDTWARVKKGVRENSPAIIGKPLYRSLAARGHIVSSPQAEKRKFDLACRRELGKAAKKTLAVSINFSEDCNLRCPYCVNRSRRAKTRMSREHLDSIFLPLWTAWKNRATK